MDCLEICVEFQTLTKSFDRAFCLYFFEHREKSRCFFDAQKGNFEHGGDMVDNEAIVRELAGLYVEVG